MLYSFISLKFFYLDSPLVVYHTELNISKPVPEQGSKPFPWICITMGQVQFATIEID